MDLLETMAAGRWMAPGEETPAVDAQPEPAASPRPSGHGMEGAVAVPFTPRQGVAALFADDPLAFLPHGEARLRAWRQAETLYPGQGKEALAMAGYYAGINRTTVGQAFSDLPALLNYWDGGASPGEAYARYRAQLNPQEDRQDSWGAALASGYVKGHDYLARFAQMIATGSMNLYIALAENGQYGQTAWKARKMRDRLAEQVSREQEFMEDLAQYYSDRAFPSDWMTNSKGVADWLGNATRAIVSEAPRQAVQYLLMATAGPAAGALLIGAESGYSKYYELGREAPWMTDGQRWTNALLTAGINSGLEWMAGEALFGDWFGAVGAMKVGRGAFSAGARYMAGNVATEFFQEAWEQGLENAADVWTGARGDRSGWTFQDYWRNLWLGVPENAFMGGVFGGMGAATQLPRVSKRQNLVNRQAAALGAYRQWVVQGAAGRVPTGAEARIIATIDALSDAAEPSAQQAALAALKMYTIAQELYRQAGGSEQSLAAPLRAKGDEYMQEVGKLADEHGFAEAEKGRLAATANQEVVGQDGEDGTRFSLAELPDGTLFVVVDTDQHLFDGVDEAEWPKIALRVIKNNFAGKVIGEEPNTAFVNGTTAREYAYPADHKMDPDVKAAKMRAATELDNLMRAARPVDEAVDDDGRHDNVEDWKYYDVAFQVGEQFFDGKINIKKNSKGRLFYDITDIKRAAGSPLAQYESTAQSESVSRKSASTDGQPGQPPISPGMSTNISPNSETASERAKKLGSLEADANAAEAEHEALRLAPHDTAETARAVRRAASQVQGVKVSFYLLGNTLPPSALSKLAKLGKDASKVRGFYDDSTKTVYVNANVVRPTELGRLLLHEATSHAGVRQVLGRDYDRVLKAVWEAHSSDPEMLEVVRRYFPDAQYSETAGPDGEVVRVPKLTEGQKVEAADEFVARYAEGRVNSDYKRVQPSWWREFKQRLRMLLARLGWLSDTVMDDGEIETLLARAHRKLGSPEFGIKPDADLSGADGVRFDLGEPDERTARLEQAEREYYDVVRKYKGTPQWMKAPNGKPTNLTERQWVQTRTPSYKKWFGDWEVANALNFAINGNPVTTITGNEFQKDNTPLTEKVTAYYKQKYNGQVSNPELGAVRLDEEGVKDSLGHGIGSLKAAAYAAVPEVIEKGVVFDRRNNWKGRGYDTAVIIAPITIGTEKYACEVVVEKRTNRQGFYLHEVQIAKELEDAFKTPTEGSALPASRLIIAQHFETARNSSKVVDENGEPLVVYHGSKWNPLAEAPGKAVFSHGKVWNTSEGVGFYFTADKSMANSYGTAGEYFLSLKNPVDPFGKLDLLSEDEIYDISEREDLDENEIDEAIKEARNEKVRAKMRNVIDALKAKGYQFYNEIERDFIATLDGNSTVESVLDTAQVAVGFVIDENVDNEKFTNDFRRAEIEEFGIDGYVSKNYGGGAGAFVAFLPNQAKSATDNVGTYSGSEDDIRFALGEEESSLPDSPKEWGTNYSEMNGKGLEAILFLESKGEGFVPAAFHRDEIGDIAIIWGHTTETLEDKGGRGLAHLRHKHNVDWGQLAAVIEKGTVSKQNNGRYAITSSRGGVVIVSPFYDAHKINWVVTAYGDDLRITDDISSPAGSKKPGASSIRPNPLGTIAEIFDSANGKFKKSGKSGKKSLKDLDRTYLEAVKRGDMETAERMVREREAEMGYSNDESWKMDHRAPSKKTGDVSLVDLKASGLVPADYWDHPEWYTSSPEERESFHIIKNALALAERRKAEGNDRPVGIRMYRAVDRTKNRLESEFRNGDWVTPSRAYAENEGLDNPNGHRIISRYCLLRNLYWDGNSIAELGYDDGNDYSYKDTANNRKLRDVVTYDDEGNVIPLSKRFNKRESDIRLSLESYGKAEGDQAVAVLRPFLLEWETATPEACLDYLRRHGFERLDLSDAEELMREADRQNLYGDAEAARESLERSQAENADPLSDGGRRVAELVRGMVRGRKSDDDIRIELARLGVSLPQERLESLLASARNGLRPDARKAFRERRDQWLAETDPLIQAMQDHGYNPSRIYIRPVRRFLGEEFKGGFIDPLWRRLSKAGQKLDEKTRERLLSSQGDRYRMSVPLDVLAHNLLSDHPGLASDEAALEELILSRFNGLTEAALDEEYRDARRREAAEDRLYSEDAEAEWRRELAERALRRIDAQEPFDAELVRDDHELAQEIWTLLTGDRRDVATLSEREIAAADAAIREGIEDAAGFVKGYAEGQRDLPQAVSEARKGDRAANAERLRKAVERLENQYKEQRARARTEEAELRRRLKEAAEADRVDLEGLRVAAQEFAKENLPPEVGGEYVGKILALAKYDTKPTRQFPEGRRKAEFRKLMDDMDWAAMEARRTRDRKALAELADRYRSRRNWKGVPVSLVPSVQRTVDRIAEVLRMSDAAVDALMAHHADLVMKLEKSEDGRIYDGQRGWSRAELDEDLAILQEYGRLGASPDSKAATALADLRKLAETGKADYAQKIAERTERRRQSAAKLKAELAGTRNVKGRAAEGSDGGRLDNYVLLNHLTTRSCFSFLAGEANMGEGFDDTEAGRLYALVEKSSYGEMTRMRTGSDRFNEAIARISGARTMKERKAWWHKVRDVQEHTGVFVDFYSSEYGSREDGTSFFRQGVRKGQRLAVDVEAARRAVAEFERTGSATVDTEAGMRRLDEMAVGFLKRQLADFDAGLESDVQFSPDEDENNQIKAELAQLRKDGKVQVLLPSKDEVAVRRELALSQGQALQAWLTWRQEDCRAGMRWNGWNDESIRQLEAFLDPQIRAMGEWMRAEFRAGRAELDQAAFEKFGAHLPDNEDYFPTRYARNQGAGLSERGGKAATITPGFLASRKFHTLPIDLTQDAFQVFAGAMRDQAHFLAWGTTLDEVNGVLGQGDVQEAIRNRYSDAFLSKLKDRIQLLRGGQDAGERLDFWLGAATHVFAASKLGFNFVSAAKQWLGTFAYLNDCSPAEMARALGTAFFNLGNRDLYRRFAKAALDSDYLKNRLEGGMDRDLRYVLASAKATGLEGEYHPLAEKAVQWMYALPQYADRLSTLTGGYAVFLHNYEGALKAGESDAAAFEAGMRAWMRSTDETQQSAYLKDQNSYQNSRGGLYRALTLFMSNPIQVSNRELVAFREAWEKGGRTWSGFAKTLALGNPDGAAARRAILANHLVVPALMLLASGLLKYGLLDYWDEAEAEDYFVDALMGSWDSVAISGGMVRNGLRNAIKAAQGEAGFGAFIGQGNSYAPGADELMDNLSAILRSGGNLKDDLTSRQDWLDLFEETFETAGILLPGVGAVPVAGSAALHQARRAERMLRDEETLKAEKKERAKAKAKRTREKNKAKKQEE